MTREDQLIEKTFFETFLSDGDNRRPSRILGQAYFEEQNREDSFDLSYIRFAQGEIYFHDLDYEAAIFKWENIKNELEPWAKMNIGDAYSQLGLLSAAEDMYNSIETSEDTLKSEVALKLFFLYKERGKTEHAYETIKKAVLLDPDYPNVTRIARDFYEENEDEENAVKLAVDELIRTEKEEWFSVITSYVKAGNTKNFSPDFFADALLSIHDVNKHSFISFTHALWNSYRNEESYLQWINTINELFMIVQHEEEFQWNSIVQLYEETFIELTDGRYFLQILQDMMPNLLSCWLKLSTRENGLTPAATVLAWNEIFPGHINQDSIYRAEAIIFEVENNQSGMQQALQLFKTVKKWAEGHSLAVDYKTVWWLEELLNSNIKQHFLLAGFEGSGKTTFMHSLLGEKPYKGTTTSMVVYHDDDELSISQITSTGHRYLENQREMLEEMEEASLFQVKQPCIFLHENQCAIIDTPALNSSYRNEFFSKLLLADGVFFVLDGADPLSDEEYNVLSQMKKFAPEIKVHFILNKVDLIASDANTQAMINDIKRKVISIYSEADILPYSSLHPFSQQSSKLNTFVNAYYPFDMKEKPNKRTANVLAIIRNVLSDLLHKREEMEKGFIYSIQWNEDILGRLKGLSLKLTDLQHEKVEAIIAAYRSLLKEGKTELMETIPKLLKESSEYIKEDSDFKQIHINLNEKMNEKIQTYIEGTLLPTVYNQLDTWVSASHDEFLESQSFLVEMSETFNDIYQENKLSLQCDFALLDDWRRDLDRMTGRIQFEKENIMLKKKPAQLLLKGAGRLLGTMNQSNNMLYNHYKKYVENESYEEVTASIANKLFLPFELFEKGLSQDVSSFFQGAIQEVKDTIAETENIIQDGKESLDNMRSNPEVFYDPLKLFEVNLLQQEFSLQAKKDYSRTS